MWTAVSLLNFTASLVMLCSAAEAWRHGNRAGAIFTFALGVSVAALAMKYWWEYL